MAAVVTEETSDGQVDGHRFPGPQVEGYHDGGAVLLVLHISFSGSWHHPTVDLQAGAGSQAVTGRAGVTVDGEGKAVDTRARNSKDARVRVVATSQVDEDVFVGDELVVAEGAKAAHAVLIGQSDGEGTSAGWTCSSGGKWNVSGCKDVKHIYCMM